MRRGIDISSIDFFYNLQLAFVRSFLFFYILMFERFRYSNTLLINLSTFHFLTLLSFQKHHYIQESRMICFRPFLLV